MAKDELAGRLVRCPKCGKNFLVPTAAKAASQPVSTATYQVACACGRTYQVQPSMAGRKVQCNACHCQFIVPHPPGSQRRAVAASQPAPDPFAGLGPLDNLGDLSGFGDPLGGTFPPTNTAQAPTYGSSYGMSATTSGTKKKKRPINKKTIQLIVLGAVSAVAILSIGFAAFTVYPMFAGYRSPQAVWEANRKAMMNEDWKTMYDTMAPTAQEQMVGGVTMLNQMVANQDPKLAEILKRHGVEPAAQPDMSTFEGFAAFEKSGEKMKQTASGIKDKRGYFVEIMKYFSERGQEQIKAMGKEDLAKKLKAEMKSALEAATLKDVEINGDQARGKQTMTANGRTIETPIVFERVEGSWRMHPAGLSNFRFMDDALGG